MTDFLSDPFFILYDKLFFQVYSGTPHPIVGDFIKRHTSMLRVLPNDTQWTMYPPGHEELKWQFITRSIQFKEHPFYVFEFWRANFKVHNSELEDWICSQYAELSFEFTSKKDALAGFDKVCDAFEPFSTKRQKTVTGTHMVIYRNNNREVGYSITVILGRDNFRYRKYKMVVTSEETLHMPE